MNLNKKTHQTAWGIATLSILSLLPATKLHAQDDADELKQHYVKGDTLTFYADAFVLPEGANLDRLLRKLPHVTYYSSGNVEIDGIKVKEMMVDSKTFFKNAISTLTSRIPAYAIYMVKFYDYDQGKRLTITLKKEFKGKWWADFSAALGPDSRYSEKAFAMIDDKKLRMTAYVNFNDINDSRQPGQETEWTPAEAAKNQRTTQMAGWDYRWKQKKWDVTGYITFNRTNTHTVTDINRTNFISSGNTYQTSHADGNNIKTKIETYHDFHTMLGKVDLHVKPKFVYNAADNTTTTDATLDGDQTTLDEATNDSTTTRTRVNDSHNVVSTVSHNYQANLVATASVKFDNKRKQVKMEIGGTNKGGDETKLTDQTINYYDVSIDSTYHYRQQLTTRPIDYLDFYTKMSYIWLTKHTLGTAQFQIKRINQHEEMLEEGTKNGNNSYDQREKDTFLEWLLKYRWSTVNSWGVWSMNLYLPLGLHHITRTYERADYYRQHTRNHLSFDAKNTYFQWRSNNLQHKLTLFFQSTTTLPEVEQLEDVTITTDAQNYYKGNDNLKSQLYTDSRLTYTYLSKNMRYEIGFQVEREQTINAIVKRLCYDRPSGKKLYTYDNANGVHNTKMTWILGLPLTHSGNLHLHNSLALARQKTVSLEDTKDKNAPEDADVVTTRKETAVRSIDNDLRLKLKLGLQVFTLRSRFRQSFSQSGSTVSHPIDYEVGLLAHLQLPWGLDLANNFNLYCRRQYSSSQLNTNDFVWDARLVRTFMKGKLMVVLEGFDLLRNLKHVTYTITESYASSQTTNVIPSYAMACVVYRLNYNNKKYRKGLHWY